MKKLSFILSFVIGIVAENISLELSHDVIVFKDLRNNTYAQIGSNVLANKMGKEVGDIIASTQQGLTDAEVIQKALDCWKLLKGGVPPYTKGVGSMLIKRGVYDLGNKGLKIPWPSHFVLEGEGCDTNEPEVWSKIKKGALGGTYLVYRGTDVAVGYITRYNPATGIEIRDITIVLLNSAVAGLDIPTIMMADIERISVIAKKRSKYGIHISAYAGNTYYFRNIYIIGPFQTGLDYAMDWGIVTNVVVKGFLEKGIQSGSYPFILGGLLKAGR